MHYPQTAIHRCTQSLGISTVFMICFPGGAIYVEFSKLDVKGSNFTQNQVGHESPEKGSDLECLF